MPLLQGLLAAAALAAPLAAPPAGAQAAPREAPAYAALPMRDLSGESEAALHLQEQLQAALVARGASFAPADALERVMVARRIRYTDSIGVLDARAVGEATGARFLLTGALLSYVPGPEPRMALSVRVLDLQGGQRVESALVSLRGGDFRGLLGIGVIEDVDELEREVLARVLADFDPAGWPRTVTPDRRKLRGLRPSDPLSFFRHESFDPAALERLVVMPLVNATSRPEAGMQFSEILANGWFRAGGVQVVEVSEVRAALVRARVRSVDLLDGETYARLGRDLETRYFVLGRLDAYSEEVYSEATRYPEVEASVRILDVETGRIVAAASVRRRGNDYETLLGLGIVRDLQQLADRTAREIVALILA